MHPEYRYFHLGCGGEILDTGLAVEREPQFRCSRCLTEGCPDLIYDPDSQCVGTTEIEFQGCLIRVVPLVLPARFGTPAQEQTESGGWKDIIIREVK